MFLTSSFIPALKFSATVSQQQSLNTDNNWNHLTEIQKIIQKTTFSWPGHRPLNSRQQQHFATDLPDCVSWRVFVFYKAIFCYVIEERLWLINKINNLHLWLLSRHFTLHHSRDVNLLHHAIRKRFATIGLQICIKANILPINILKMLSTTLINRRYQSCSTTRTTLSSQRVRVSSGSTFSHLLKRPMQGWRRVVTRSTRFSLLRISCLSKSSFALEPWCTVKSLLTQGEYARPPFRGWPNLLKLHWVQRMRGGH